jgi:putative ABC transport system permease protein
MGLRRDIRYAFRLLWADKIATLVIVATLALSIGANTTLFSVIDAVWLNAIPYPDASRLIRISNRNEQFPDMAVSWGDADDWHAQDDIFEDVALISPRSARITLTDDPILLRSPLIQPSVFRILGEVALAGRLLTDADAEPGAEPVVVISQRFSRQQFSDDRAAVGRVLKVGGKPATIVGVASARLPSVIKGEVFRALARPATIPRGSRDLQTIAKLRRGVSLAAAQTRLTDVSTRAAARDPAVNGKWRAHAQTLRDAIVGVDVGRTLTLLGSAVALVLLIGCTNVASLLLARTSGRTNEVAVRSALGASRPRLIRQLFTESLVLAAIASGTGLLLLRLTRDSLVAIMPTGIPHVEDIGINGRVLGFAMAATVLSTVLAGSLPALKLSTLAAPRTAGRAHTVRTRRLNGLLVATETALSVVVLVVAGLLVGSFIRLVRVDAGFSPKNVVLFSLASRTPGATASAADDGAVLDELRRLPYVRAAGAIDQTPLGGSRVTYGLTIPGRPTPSNQLEIDLRRASPAYFATMGIPLRNGRDFSTNDSQGAPGVAIINERAARMFWPGENPVGAQVQVGGPVPLTIVGIVGDVRHLGLDRDPAPELYRPWAQEPLGGLEFVALVDHDPQQLIALLTDPKRTLPGARRVRTAGTFDEQVSESIRAPRFRTLLFGLLGTLVLGLTIVGVAGVTAHTVATRTRELGIRLALGARPDQLASMVVSQSAIPVAIGCAAGAIMAWWSVRFVEGFLFGVTVRDPLTFVGSLFVLLAAATVAAWVPARAATRIDPAVALRDA